MEDVTTKALAMLGGVLGLAGSAFGLLAWNRRMAFREAQAELTQARMLEHLESAEETLGELKEMLRHPGETDFSIAPVMEELQVMTAELRVMNRHLEALRARSGDAPVGT